jgi:hypothetical protein
MATVPLGRFLSGIPTRHVASPKNTQQADFDEELTTQYQTSIALLSADSIEFNQGPDTCICKTDALKGAQPKRFIFQMVLGWAASGATSAVVPVTVDRQGTLVTLSFPETTMTGGVAVGIRNQDLQLPACICPTTGQIVLPISTFTGVGPTNVIGTFTLDSLGNIIIYNGPVGTNFTSATDSGWHAFSVTYDTRRLL